MWQKEVEHRLMGYTKRDDENDRNLQLYFSSWFLVEISAHRLIVKHKLSPCE